MKKTLFLIFFAVMLVFGQTAVLADKTNVIDNAGLLTQTETATLEEKADALYESGFDIVILTMTGGYGTKTVSEYADDYYDANGFGCGSERTGVLFLVNMTERDIYISTAGEAVYAFTDYGITSLLDTLYVYFADGDYYGGFTVFINAASKYIAAYEEGEPIDSPKGDYNDYITTGGTVYYEDGVDYGKVLAVCALIGFIISATVMLFVRKSMNTARISKDASHAIGSDGFTLTRSRDRYLYSRTRRIPRDTNSSSGSRSGGSSVHRSSGGVRHGGGGRKF